MRHKMERLLKEENYEGLAQVYAQESLDRVLTHQSMVMSAPEAVATGEFKKEELDEFIAETANTGMMITVGGFLALKVIDQKAVITGLEETISMLEETVKSLEASNPGPAFAAAV